MKIWNIVKTDFEGPQTVQEGWKDALLSTVFGVASVFGGVKAQNAPVANNNMSINQDIKNDTFRLDIGKIFASGRYNFDPKDAEALKLELKKLGSQIAKHPDSNFTIQIVSSESKVPNYDAEPNSPSFQQKLGVGGLASKRAETVGFIFKTFTDQLKKEGVLKGNVEITAPKILIGDVPWPSVDPASGQKKSKDDPSYTKDQYVYANIKVINKNTATANPYSVFSKMGEEIYYNNNLVGMLFVPDRSSTDKNQSGNVNTAYQDILFKTVKPNTSLNGNIDEKGVYTKSYVIPWQWWNKNVMNKHLSKANVDFIVQNFASK